MPESVVVVVWVVLGVTWFACAFFTATVAASKGRNAETWGVLGFLFGWTALIAAAGLAPGKRSERLFPTRRCPQCASHCPVTARICGQCREAFDQKEWASTICRAIATEDVATLSDLLAALRGVPDREVLDELHAIGKRAVQSGDPSRVARIVVHLVNAGDVERLGWFPEDVCEHHLYRSADVWVALDRIAHLRSPEAARVLKPLLAIRLVAERAYHEVGEAALPVLEEVALGESSEARVASAIAKRMSI